MILLAGLCLCLSLNRADKYRQAEKTYDDILEKYTKEKKVSKKKQDFVVDWKKLWKTNKDVVGWIKMDSGADYPILHGDSNEEYLHTDLYGDYNINGSIFVNADNSRDWSDPNTIKMCIRDSLRSLGDTFVTEPKNASKLMKLSLIHIY